MPDHGSNPLPSLPDAGSPDAPARARSESEYWSRYFDAVHGLPPRDTLTRALDLFAHSPPAGHTPGTCPCHPDALGVALDFGCGSGRDTLEMLSRGWCVLAIDAQHEAINRLVEHVPDELMPLLRTGVETFEEMPLPPAMFDVINASFAIPHVAEREFGPLWQRIAQALRPGGRFAGQLFGVNDSWNTPAGGPDGIARTFHSRQQVDDLLAGLHVEHLEEIERDGKDAFSRPKHWHVFHIVARKPT